MQSFITYVSAASLLLGVVYVSGQLVGKLVGFGKNVFNTLEEVKDHTKEIDRISATVAGIGNQTRELEHNGGSSIKDAVRDLLIGQETMMERLNRQDEVLAELSAPGRTVNT